MRQFRPEGPKKTIEEICAKYGLLIDIIWIKLESLIIHHI